MPPKSSALSAAMAASISKGVDKSITRRQPASTPSPTASTNVDMREAPVGLATPPPSAKKDPPDMHSLPELADQYVLRVSTIEQVEYLNARKFCVKPACWKRWTASDYASFADDLRQQFDPVSLARQRGIPVDEVQQVFSAIVCNPLYDAAEATRRGEEGMQQIFDLYNKYGTPSRVHGKDGAKRIKGELAGIEQGVVVITGTTTGNKYKLPAEQLSEADLEYLEATVTGGEMELLRVGVTNASRDVVMLG
ncbi:hypothetical protein LTR36_001777 [Oleoguttula mirabilis]|uniref:Uncharacterized protein n=1 Tax=Oleoguttula mirabilis TaxID=1507867 RepID=A0AAV9JM09_9PEZI|nr:hypothetical protein LTR36_001777 [Oleoguttula mirabilis]